ncbi:site-specific integrase [Pseudonocardia sp.]|uniref:site-specific integrase n=1 Tax=Pseudonocardia sp. TaxID=60912 RepID=UPI0031FD1A2E
MRRPRTTPGAGDAAVHPLGPTPRRVPRAPPGAPTWVQPCRTREPPPRTPPRAGHSRSPGRSRNSGSGYGWRRRTGSPRCGSWPRRRGCGAPSWLGVRRDSLNLEAGTLTIDETLISVGGRAEESDGKTDAGVRTVSLDAFTVGALRPHLAMLDDERAAFGTACAAGGWLFVWLDGRRPHPDSVTDRFNRLVDRAGARRIRLHDVRHTYSTLSLDTGIEPKILSDRVGHSNPAVTFQIYAHRSTGQDRAAAELIGRLIERAVPRTPLRRLADRDLLRFLLPRA